MTNSGNDRLRAAMLSARLDSEGVAGAIKVDPKSVRRWLGGSVPYPRLRFALAQLLSEDPEYLWPSSAPAAKAAITQELLALYGNRTDLPLESWREMFRGAREQIDLLGYDVLFLTEQHAGLIALLTQSANQGCRIRICLAGADAPEVRQRDEEEGLNGSLAARVSAGWTYLAPLASVEGVKFRRHGAPFYNSLFRFDKEMLVTPHIYATPSSQAPLLHLRRIRSDGAFEKFASHFDKLWARADQIFTNVATGELTEPTMAAITRRVRDGQK